MMNKQKGMLLSPSRKLLLLLLSTTGCFRGPEFKANNFDEISSNSGGGGGTIDSPCSSRASAVGSSYSEPWSCVVRDEDAGSSLSSQAASGAGGAGGGSGGGSMAAAASTAGHGGSTMVLRKRIRKIKEGMKK